VLGLRTGPTVRKRTDSTPPLASSRCVSAIGRPASGRVRQAGVHGAGSYNAQRLSENRRRFDSTAVDLYYGGNLGVCPQDEASRVRLAS